VRGILACAVNRNLKAGNQHSSGHLFFANAQPFRLLYLRVVIESNGHRASVGSLEDDHVAGTSGDQPLNLCFVSLCI
jgi:hypothetical protein